MKKVEILTTQNVVIEYELASLFERAGAFFIDFIIIWSVIGLLNLSAWIFSVNSLIFFYTTSIPVFLFYNLLFEMLNNGQSIGKYLLKLKVVKITDGKADAFDYLMRWTFRMIDIYFSLGTLASLMVYSSNRCQRVGDFFADTSVIKVLEKNRYSLNSIIKINDKTEYQPVYNKVIDFTEKEVLLIKETYDRYIEQPTHGHQEALDLLLSKICNHLEINKPQDKKVFIKTLIKDYVYLTR
jgi:uncharacterized RDD family membrane protein YckC